MSDFGPRRRAKPARYVMGVPWTILFSALAVDDDDTICNLTALLLHLAGFDTVDTACDGREALDMMGVREYRLVVLDLRMPRLSGYDVLSYLASNPLPKMPKSSSPLRTAPCRTRR